MDTHTILIAGALLVTVAGMVSRKLHIAGVGFFLLLLVG